MATKSYTPPPFNPEMRTEAEFLAYLESIDEKYWCIDDFTNRLGQHCAQGFFEPDGEETEIGDRLRELFRNHDLWVSDVNNRSSKQFPQLNPKDRVCAALRWMIEQSALVLRA